MTQDEVAKPEPSKDEPHKEAPAGAQPADRINAPEGDGPNWVLRIVLVMVALVAAFIAFRVSAAFFPRWWAQRVADQVKGDFTDGTLWGLFYGFVFTFVPLLLLFQIRRRFFNWTWRIIVTLIALLLAAPNWLTLSVVLGTSKAAHAGERIMDVDAPNFRAGTLAGVIIGAAAALALTAMSLWLARRKNQVKRLKNERDQLRKAVSKPADE
ncbi:glucan phosphoethanolaminetransferase (alkaline phosphatase superfamily) [Aeromicrobium panaciterrae]|uniref:Glucan phosphoethanolaminetransferase (Alkaline phosphatase superfamily) n=1 Tax=Aeromicrobium panaciterrae TaxID=363861 RepID=A0ABU1UL54_9ACTN|nr:hypothetical protein [Aeromicrobium panaciterrae]MDR7085879.1 glucan phosphoethanolaminetransferase (alkaline phosphatase superfamily) [Aeromicrobium panaciterrae]